MRYIHLFAFAPLCPFRPSVDALPSLDSLGVTDPLGIQTVSTGYLFDYAGNSYSLSALRPLEELLSPSGFIPLHNGSKELDHRTGEVFSMPIFRATYDDGTIFQVEKDDEGVILYAEIRSNKGLPDTFFV